ncbi:MAG: putative DNA binding domain-containing protein [bacterium]|nr:putative DNA binding domain-containing protein [bacterium]
MIQSGEGQYIEFKSALDRSRGETTMRSEKDIADDIAEGWAAFANTDGGTFLLGVEDDGTITGANLSNDQLARLPNFLITRWLDPVPFKHVTAQSEQGTIHIFEVDILPTVHSLSDGRTPYRVGRQTVCLPANQIQDLKRTKGSALYERQTVPGATMDDLDKTLLDEFRKTTGTDDGTTEIDALVSHDLALMRGQQPQLSLAACLVFGKPPMARFHERCGIVIRRFAGDTARAGTENNETFEALVEEPLPRLLRKVFETVQGQIKVSRRLKTLFFEERPEYPQFAWQEAVVNAVVHRNYVYRGNDIEIRMFDDRMEVKSPGLPPAPVTVEQLQRRMHTHASRNPRLMRLMKAFRFVRERGEGLPRIFEVMEESCLRPPELRAEGDFFMVTLWNTPVFDDDTMTWLESFRDKNLSARQRRILAHTYQNRGYFTLSDYASVNSVSREVAQREIRLMLEMNIVELIGTRRAAKYYPLIQRGTLVDRLKDYFSRHAFLTNRDLRRIIGPMSPQEASRRLQELVDSGWVERRGQRRGAKYYPTDKFTYHKNTIHAQVENHDPSPSE